MGITQVEYKKQTQDPLRAGVVQIYLDVFPALQWLSFSTIKGGSLTFNQEGTLPSAGFREVGNKFTASSGILTPVTENLTISGGKIEIDRALREMYGDDRLNTDMRMKTKALAIALNIAWYKGDGTGGSYTGLQSRIAASETINNGVAGLSLSKLREAIVRCRGSVKKVFLSTEMKLIIDAAKNDVTLGSQIQMLPGSFGEPATFFAGAELVLAGEDASQAEILDFSEASSTTSIYVVGFGPDGVEGIQSGPMRTYFPKKEAVDTEIDIEWIMSYIINAPRSAYRVDGITNAAATA